LTSAATGQAIGQAAEPDDEHHDIEEIIVEATALPRTVEQLAQPVSVLSGEELANKMAPSLGEILATELGVSSTYFGPVASRPVIRGQFGERVRVLTNGLDSLDASALSEDHQTSVEGILAERVEIVRGPATLLYGSGAAGGLVNVVDNRIVEEPLETPFSGKVAVNASTAIGEEAGAGLLKFGNDSFALHIDYFRRETDDVEIPGFVESAVLRRLEDTEGVVAAEARGKIDNSASSTDGGALAATWFGNSGFVGLSASSFNSEYDVPGSHGHEQEPPAPGAEEEVRIDLQQTRYDMNGEMALPGPFDSLRFRLASNEYDHTEFEGAEVGTMYRTDGLDARIEARHKQLGRLEGAIGVQYKRIDFTAIGDEAFVPPSDTTRTSFFVFEEYPVSASLVLQGSLRAESQTIDGTSLAIDYDDFAFGGALGAIWTLSETVTLAARLSLTERHPNSTELYADGEHVAVQRFERGSVTIGSGILDKEVSHNIDLTLRGNSDRVDWTLTVFNNDVDDYIVLAPTSDVVNDLQVFEYGQVDARLRGFEAEARIELLDWKNGHLHARLFGDYVRGEEKASGDYLPRLTPLRYGIGLHLTTGALEFSAEAATYDEQTRTAPNELPTDGYTLVGATLSCALDNDRLYLFLRGSNLGNEDARQHTSPLKDSVPLPGRSLHAGLRFAFP
jgi:iron complex outermembrane receptor protein